MGLCLDSAPTLRITQLHNQDFFCCLQVLKPVFVEPSTGRLINPASAECPYTGVELVWNASNAWICMQVCCRVLTKHPCMPEALVVGHMQLLTPVGLGVCLNCVSNWQALQHMCRCAGRCMHCWCIAVHAATAQ